jgi:hypothetical protein
MMFGRQRLYFNHDILSFGFAIWTSQVAIFGINPPDSTLAPLYKYRDILIEWNLTTS